PTKASPGIRTTRGDVATRGTGGTAFQFIQLRGSLHRDQHGVTEASGRTPASTSPSDRHASSATRLEAEGFGSVRRCEADGRLTSGKQQSDRERRSFAQNLPRPKSGSVAILAQ